MLKPVANISGSTTREFLGGLASVSSLRTLLKFAGFFSQTMSCCRAITFILEP